MTTVMVVDDEGHIRELVRLYLEDEGMEVVEQSDGEAAWAHMMRQAVDLVVLDVMMPRLDGWELCRRIRETGDVPILMITAKGEPTDRIKGFRLGTDDYLVKPFDPVEMVLRVKALLKRYKIATSQTIRLGDVLLDKKSYLVELGSDRQAATLPMKEFELLYTLASYPGQLFTRDMLIRRIWGMDYDGDERTVDTHIKRLREKFAGHAGAFRIVTLRGLGYRLELADD
ncbi:response regulator transcription factor [Cohnella fermenti]|uniref:Heme response regulator HssR n=1 Tax=Cohnella fermenti TaxID=2565925 RepID=A0A4S4BNU2_9BACL|nr:response regulator transcription factor [Cohnella fermenti]THF76379.1 response regulator transcription factor [Cohnella fermenti]